MRWLYALSSRSKLLFRRRRESRLLDAELQFHLDQQVLENIASGMPAEAARRAALRDFGNPVVVREQTHETWSWIWLERLVQDIRFALRQIARAPGFACVAILILALGIGANNAVFTLTHSLLLRSLPIRDPEQVVRLAINMHVENPDGNNSPLNLPIIQAIQARARSFSGVFGWCIYDFVLSQDGNMHGIHGAVVSGNAFQVLGVQPALGRMLNAADDQSGGGPDGWAAVISYRKWVEQYHADPAVIGKQVTVTDRGVTIVGVAPPKFEGILVAEQPDIYLPLEFDAALNGEGGLHSPGRLWLITFARLKTGVTRAEATTEMGTVFPSVLDQIMPPAVRHLPIVEKSQLDVDSARSGWSTLRLQYTKPLLFLQSLVAVVLLICCASLSGLFLARASSRQQEFAIRGALGAPRSRLMRQLLVESFLLALPGALIGIGIAWAAGPLIRHSLGSRQAELSLSGRPDLTVLCVTAFSAFLCAILFGMAPAWIASRYSVEAALRGSNRRTGARSGGSSVRLFFVPFQVALSLALVVVATLLGATVVHLRTGATGFSTKNVIFVLTDFNRLPQKGAELVSLYRRTASRLQAQPDVEDASVAEIPPLLGWRDGAEFRAADDPAHATPTLANVNHITAHFFSSIGTPIVAGRDLRDEDADAGFCLLNQSAAKHYFPNTSAIGSLLQQVSYDMGNGTNVSTTCQVVGIAGDTKYDSLHDSHPLIVYLPVTAGTAGLTHLFFVIHARNDQAAATAYRTVLHEMAPTSPETDPSPFTQQFSDSIAREQLLSVLSGFFAVLALLLSVVGIYGLVAWDVTQRTMEIGLRMALGATRTRVIVLVMRQVAAILAVGIVVGGGAGFFAARAIRGFLFEVQPGNAGIFLFSALLLTIFGLLAAILPAGRAISIDPMQALRTE